MLRPFALGLALLATAASAQPTGMPEWFDASKTGPYGQPVFHAAPVADTTMAEFRVVATYYTVGGNIDDPASSVFMAEDPAPADYARFARETPSYAFIVVAEDEARSVVSLWQDPADDSFWFLVPTPGGEDAVFVPAEYEFASADPVLTEVRGMELLQAGVDAEAAPVEGEAGQVQVVFNGARHNVLPFGTVLSDVLTIVREHALYR